MKATKFFALATAAILALGTAACSGNTGPAPGRADGQIYLYGELHGFDAIKEKELALWYGFYHNDGLRHLFIETPYYTAEFLNLWMQADDDAILDDLDADAKGTFRDAAFYKAIKKDCPETVFHGTDIGHQRGTTGKRYIEHLAQNGLADSEQYRLAQEAVQQGEHFYLQADDAYRENKMVENFVRAFEALEGHSVMGIYGGAHTGGIVMEASAPVLCMADQLREQYGDAVHTEYLPWLMEPSKTDAITIEGREYAATFYGKQDTPWVEGFAYREFWRLENAYDDFKNHPKAGYDLPCYDYPMPVKTGQVFVIRYIRTDGTAVSEYYRSDGGERDGVPTTEAFTVA